MESPNLKKERAIRKTIWSFQQLNGFGITRMRALLELVGSLANLAEFHFLDQLKADSHWGASWVQDFERVFGSGAFDVEEERYFAKGISIVSLVDLNYPKLLAATYDAPIILYVRGTLVAEDEAALAIVGTRYPSAYGRNVASRFAQELAARGVTIVSGMARGIDAEAHRGALLGRGRTIAVLGSGIDVIYPKEHRELYEEISSHGAVLSEFVLGIPPLAFNFPKRNRIISGLAHGVLVVEASVRSGSLITARQALDEGRDVYAIPGQIDSVNAGGSNQLIQEGAKLVTSPDEILSELVPKIRDVVQKPDEVAVHEDLPSGASTEASLLIKRLKENPAGLDELALELHTSNEHLCRLLRELELAGKVKRGLGGLYAPV